MPTLHLAHHAIGNVVRRSLASLLRDHELPREMQQKVTQFLPDRVRIFLPNRVIELEYLLDQVGSQRLARLRAIPGAAHPQVAHEVQHPLQRWPVLHGFSVPVTYAPT